jgi:hypothetical protein
LAEYGRALPDVTASLDEEHGPSRLYYGRLLGIMIKEPFSEVRSDPELRDAKRRWELVPERLKEKTAQATWQFQLISRLQTESLGYAVESYPDVDTMVQEVKRETGFFWHLLRSLRKYTCGDPEFSKELKKKVDELRRSGTAATLPSASIAATLASFLVAHVPWLGIASAPIIAGVVLLLWQIGVDAFCSWSEQIIESRVWYRDS